MCLHVHVYLMRKRDKKTVQWKVRQLVWARTCPQSELWWGPNASWKEELSGQGSGCSLKFIYKQAMTYAREAFNDKGEEEI